MKIFRLDLLTLVLISLFSFNACRKSNPNDIGLAVPNSEAINTTLISTLPISTITVRDELLQTNTLSKHPYGILNDPLFGTTEANLLISLNLPSSNLSFGTNPTIDSAVVVLNYGNEYLGDPAAVFNFKIHQLDNRLLPTSNLYNNNTDTYQAPIIGTQTGRIDIDKKVQANDATGTSITLAPQVRIRLNNTFAQTILGASSTTLANNDTFGDFIKGLYLKATPSSSSTGGIVFFDLATGASKLELYYHNQGNTNTQYTSLPIISSGTNPCVAAFSHNFSGSGATEVQNNIDQIGANYNFVQPLAGVRTKVYFPDLTALSSQKNITINKAELVVTTQTLGSDVPSIFSPAPKLYLYQTDIAGQRKFLPDGNAADLRFLGDSDFGGTYNTTDQKYRFIITSYIQDLVNNNAKQYNTYLSVVDPNSTRAATLLPSGTTAKRVVIGSGTAGAPLQMKLNIIYSKTN